MTEQATLTPEEQAILALASAVCRTCEGTRVLVSSISNEDYTEEETTMDCPDCLGSDGKPTGGRFHALRVECNCAGDETHRNLHELQEDFCQGRGWVPVAWTDEYTIRQALMAGGFSVELRSLWSELSDDVEDGVWGLVWIVSKMASRVYVKLPVLAIAADSAITAEASNDDLG